MGFSLSSLNPFRSNSSSGSSGGGTVSRQTSGGSQQGSGDMLGIGSAIGGFFNYRAQQDTNKANTAMTREQMQFQERMASTGHQREVYDLQQAGLNPILSAGGNGAPGAQGASPNLQAPQIDMPAIISMVSAKQNQQRIDQDQQRIEVEKRNSAASIAKNLSDVEINKANTLATKGGIGTKFLGTDVYEKTNKPIGPAIKQFFNPRSPLENPQQKLNQGRLP